MQLNINNFNYKELSLHYVIFAASVGLAVTTLSLFIIEAVKKGLTLSIKHCKNCSVIRFNPVLYGLLNFVTDLLTIVNNFIQVLDTRIDFLTIFLVSLFSITVLTNFFVVVSSRKKAATKGSGKPVNKPWACAVAKSRINLKGK